MIKEDYVSFEIAKLLKEKGFDWEESPFYCEQDRDEWRQENNYMVPNPCYNSKLPFDTETLTMIAPHISLQMAMKWLRKIHHIDICVCRELDEYGKCFNGYIAVVYQDGCYKVTIRNAEGDLTYEEAANRALKYCLVNLIK